IRSAITTVGEGRTSLKQFSSSRSESNSSTSWVPVPMSTVRICISLFPQRGPAWGNGADSSHVSSQRRHVTNRLQLCQHRGRCRQTVATIAANGRCVGRGGDPGGGRRCL